MARPTSCQRSPSTSASCSTVFRRTPPRRIRRARKLGKLLVSDTDDLVFNHAVAHHIEAIEDMSDEWREAWAESYRRTIEDCGSGATASTKTLRRHLLTLTGPVEVLPNVVNDEMIRLAAHARGTKASPGGGAESEVAIAYFSGSLTHRGDFEEAAEAVVWALETYPHVRFVAVGRLELDARFKRFAARIERSPGGRGRRSQSFRYRPTSISPRWRTTRSASVRAA